MKTEVKLAYTLSFSPILYSYNSPFIYNLNFCSFSTPANPEGYIEEIN